MLENPLTTELEISSQQRHMDFWTGVTGVLFLPRKKFSNLTAYVQ